MWFDIKIWFWPCSLPAWDFAPGFLCAWVGNTQRPWEVQRQEDLPRCACHDKRVVHGIFPTCYEGLFDWQKTFISDRLFFDVKPCVCRTLCAEHPRMPRPKQRTMDIGIKIMMFYFLMGDKWKMFQTSQLCSNLDTWVGKWDSGETLSERSANEWTKPHRPSRLDMLMDIHQRGYVKVIPRRRCRAPSGAVWQWASWLNKELTKLRGWVTYVSWVANLFWSLVLWLVA